MRPFVLEISESPFLVHPRVEWYLSVVADSLLNALGAILAVARDLFPAATNCSSLCSKVVVGRNATGLERPQSPQGISCVEFEVLSLI